MWYNTSRSASTIVPIDSVLPFGIVVTPSLCNRAWHGIVLVFTLGVPPLASYFNSHPWWVHYEWAMLLTRTACGIEHSKYSLTLLV